MGIDLATGSWTVGLSSTGEGLLPVSVDASLSTSSAYATIGIGAIDAQLGGTRLVLATPHGGAGASVHVEWAGTGGATSTAGIWPTLETDSCVPLLTTLLPAAALEMLLSALLARVKGAAGDALTTGLTVCGLLQPRTDGGPELRLPLAFVRDPGAHLVAVVRQAEADVAANAVQLLDAMAHLVTATPPGDGSWPIADGVTLQYAASGGALSVGLHTSLSETLDGVVVTSGLSAGVVLRPGVLPAPAVDVSVLVGEVGLELALDPGLRVNLLRAAPQSPLPLYPSGPGLGQAFATAAQTLVPELLNRVAALGGSSTGLAQKVGLLVGELGDGLDLRDAGQFTGARITTFAGDPSGALLSHLPVLVGQATASLVDALNGTPARATVTQQPGRATITFGTSPDTVSVTLDTTGPAPAVEVAASWMIPDVGEVSLDVLRFSAAGVTVGATIGPFPVQAGPVRLAPLVVVHAGTGSAAADRLVGIGLALDDLADRSVEVRWSLDAQPPKLVAVDRGTAPQVSEVGAVPRLLSLGVGLAGGIVVESLPTGFLDARAIRILQGVLFTETATTPQLDPQVVLDLLDPELVLARAERLLWNAATDAQPLQVTIGGIVTIGLVATDADGGKDLGVELTLASGQRFKIADDDTVVELEVDDTWITPGVAAGLGIYAVHGVRTGEAFAFSFQPGVTVGGVGLRFTKQSGPLLSLGAVGVDGFAVRVYAEARATGVGGGVQVALLGLAVAPGGAGGTNTVANGIMGDAGKSSPAQRPSFSPSLAVQAHPGSALGVTLRAGDPPGPWWVVVQRQLGPLYVERVGFDEAEANGSVSRIALLFDGSVSIFGLTASVDQLSITWLGGDPFDITQWAVDLMGLAVSADMSGVELAGGLLKTVDSDGDPAYVGMLLGKFGIYGLSVFGGYTSLGGTPSFFVFGAFNGPIGGPPAFFLTGIGGGLGINRALVAPTDPAKIDSFPFVQALDPYAQVPDPMTELKNLSIDFPPELGNFWFAAGISFTCFSLVDGVAVVAVSFGNGLEIDLLGLARMALPNPDAALVSIELGLIARFSTTEGVFLIQASLTDNSWLLYEDVRLTGGFAFATWWKGPLAGQFVLTIGGYHPDFHVDGYPVVPRLGLSWQVSSDISIKGGSYFALTSEAVMAGVGVDAVADFGWAWAKASFGADGLVYYDPLWYDVDVRATISAGVDIDTWLGTISFSVTTGCEVHVWGPDFSGEATVEVGPASVTIPFGSNAKHEGKVLGWGDFVAKYLEDAGDGAARAAVGDHRTRVAPGRDGRRGVGAHPGRHPRAAVRGVRRVRPHPGHDDAHVRHQPGRPVAAVPGGPLRRCLGCPGAQPDARQRLGVAGLDHLGELLRRHLAGRPGGPRPARCRDRHLVVPDRRLGGAHGHGRADHPRPAALRRRDRGREPADPDRRGDGAGHRAGDRLLRSRGRHSASAAVHRPVHPAGGAADGGGPGAPATTDECRQRGGHRRRAPVRGAGRGRHGVGDPELGRALGAGQGRLPRQHRRPADVRQPHRRARGRQRLGRRLGATAGACDATSAAAPAPTDDRLPLLRHGRRLPRRGYDGRERGDQASYRPHVGLGAVTSRRAPAAQPRRLRPGGHRHGRYRGPRTDAVLRSPVLGAQLPPGRRRLPRRRPQWARRPGGVAQGRHLRAPPAEPCWPATWSSWTRPTTASTPRRHGRRSTSVAPLG